VPIADQYFSTPTMDLKWLQAILRINLDVNDSICAFVAQMHIIALIDTVFDYNRQQ
jgi:hypothetical protein